MIIKYLGLILISMTLLACQTQNINIIPGSEKTDDASITENKCANGDYYTDDKLPTDYEITAQHIKDRLKHIYFDINNLEAEQKKSADLTKLINHANDATAKLSDAEKDCLELIFGGHSEVESRSLSNFAAINMDLDDYPDFMIGKYGRFFENDTDIDNDGVLNFMDVQPYEINNPDSSIADRDVDGIPDHLDWTITRKSDDGPRDAASNLQACLFDNKNCNGIYSGDRNFKLLLMDNESKLTKGTLNTIKDVLFRVFEDCDLSIDYCQNERSGFKTLKKLVASGQPYIQGNIKTEEGNLDEKYQNDRNADIHPGSQSIYVYEKINREYKHWKKLQKFLTLSHEFMHALQYSFDSNLQLSMQKNYLYKTPEFVHYINSYFSEFEINVLPIGHLDNYDHVFFNELEGESVPYQSLFLKDRFVTIKNKINKAYDDEDYEEVFSLFKEYRVVNFSQLNDIFEWHAYQFEAYLINSMINAYINKNIHDVDKKRSTMELIYKCMRDSEVFYYRYYEHAIPSVTAHFKAKFNISNDDLAYLNSQYLDFDLSNLGDAEYNDTDNWCYKENYN